MELDCACTYACMWLLVIMLFDRRFQQAIGQDDGVAFPVILHHHQKNLCL